MKTKNKLFIFFYLIVAINLSIINLYADIPIFQLKAIKLSYLDNNKIVIAEGNAHAKDKFGKEIFSDYIIYDKTKSTITAKSNAKYIDNLGNEILSNNFYYDLKLKKIVANGKVIFTEKNKNKFYFSNFEYFENSEKGFGRDFRGEMNDKSTMESKYVEIDNKLGNLFLSNGFKESLINKLKSLFNEGNKYTTCENKKNKASIYEECPDWSLHTYKTNHDFSKKMVVHKHAIIRIKNFPIFYTPYFSHPDPSVKRKSGFLPPSTKNFTNLGRTLKTPYYWSIDDDSDVTFTPIFYQNENNIFLTEYRKQNKNSLLSLDTSFSKGYKNLTKIGENGEELNRTNGSRNHIFLNFSGKYNDLVFKENDIEINIQRVSQKNYLNVNQINTSFVRQDMTNLVNNFTLNSYESESNKKIKISSSIYENLSNDDKNTKYQYKIPYVEHINYFNIYDQNAIILNNFEANNYDGDTKRVVQINNLELTSPQKIIKKFGISNIIKTKISNTNFYNDKVTSEKENFSTNLYPTIGVETILPFAKYSNEKKEEFITPKILTKYTFGSMKDSSSENKILAYEDIYSIDRMGNLSNPETGGSVGYGLEYESNNKNITNEVFLKSNFYIGQILKDKHDNKMPSSSTLNNKQSDFVGNFSFFFNEAIKNNTKKNYIKYQEIENVKQGINFDYKFNISNELNKFHKHQIQTSFANEKNSLLANYYKLDEIGENEFIEGKYAYNFDNNINILLTARKNLLTNRSENNSLELNYESDCLKFGLSLSKNFYSNDDVKTANNLTLFLMLKPFGQPISPDLTNLISNN